MKVIGDYGMRRECDSVTSLGMKLSLIATRVPEK